MSVDQTPATTEPVTLDYTLTSDDLADAMGAAHRVVRRPWYLRRSVLLPAGGVLGLVIAVARGANDFDAAWMLAVFLAVVLVLGLGLAYLVLRLVDPARLTHRWTARQMVRGNPALAHPIRTTVGATGLHVVGAAGETTVGWAQYPFHVETADSFALLASERLGAVVLPLPKRGLAGADPELLRALLAAHTRRLG